MKVKYVGNATVDTIFGELRHNDVITIDETRKDYVLGLRDKLNKPMFILIEEPKKAKKIKMVVKEDGE